MNPQINLSRQNLEHLIKLLPDSEVVAVERFVQFIIEKVNDPVLLNLAFAPFDDEELLPEEEKAIQKAREDIKKNGTVSFDEVMRKFVL